MAGTKKQKMEISKAIVEAVYSKDPPGRFLKRCSETGQWEKLSDREAADRVVQAMAYAGRGKDESKRRREELRRSRRRSRQKSVDGPVRLELERNKTTNQLLDQNISSSVAHHELAARRGGAEGNTQSATGLLRMTGNSNPQQQLHLLQQQLHQSSTSSVATLPTSADNTSNNESVADQNGLIQLLVQTLQQQQQQQQQQQLLLQLQCILNPLNNPLGQLLQPQTALQPALNVGVNQLLNQAQQQQQQLLRHLLNQQNLNPSASLPMSTSTSAPFLTGNQPQSANNLLLNLQQQSSLSNVLSQLQRHPNPSVGISSNAPHSQQQTDQLQRMMLQQNQLLASTPGNSSNNQLPILQQQQQLDPRLLQALPATTLQQLQLHLQGLPPPSINSAGMTSADNTTESAGQKKSEDEDEEQIEQEDDSE